MVVKLNPVGNHPTGVLQRLESMPMHALLFKHTDHQFDHAVLLWAMRRDELLPQAIAANQRRVISARKNEPVIASQQERLRNPPQRAEADN